MTQRQTAALVAALTIALAISSTRISRADSPNDGATTVTHTPSFQSAVFTADPATSGTAHAARYFHRRSRRHASRAAAPKQLPSRGYIANAAPNVVGRLAVVTKDNVEIRAGRERNNQVLSIVNHGQNLALCGENNTQYGVLMIDRTIGYIAKADVKMMEYQVVQDGASSDAGASPLGQRLVQEAYRYMGVRYVWGGETAAGIDCSGFVKAVYAANGITLPRVSGDQAAVGYDVPRTDLSRWVPGDRLYFACHHPRIDHTGMYIGNGMFIHAHGSNGHDVGISRVDDPYYYSHLVAVRRSAELVQEASAATGTTVTTQALPRGNDAEATEQ